MIYLDSNATRPLVKEAENEIKKSMKKLLGNPSSQHFAGRNAKAILEETRYNILKSLNAVETGKLIFTSSGTEANNIAINGFHKLSLSNEKKGLITTPLEHPSVINPVKQISKTGYPVHVLNVDNEGIVDVEHYRELCRTSSFSSIQWANQETGTIQNIKRFAVIAKRRDVLIHSDAVQAYGKIPIDFDDLEINSISLSSHKIGGPQGIGALIVKKQFNLPPLYTGGKQENNTRPGTEAVLLAAGFNGAVKTLVDLEKKNKKIRRLRDFLKTELIKQIPVLQFNGNHTGIDTGNCLSICFPGTDGNLLSIFLDMKGFAVSRGSACQSGASLPSQVLLSMGRSKEESLSTLRISLYEKNTKKELIEFIKIMKEYYNRKISA